MNIYNKFNQRVGEISRCIQYLELSLRVLKSEHSADLENYQLLSELAYSHNLTLTSIESTPILNQLANLYIINLHSCFEEYLKDILALIKKRGIQHPLQKEDESLLNYILTITKKPDRNSDIKQLSNLCEYYRLVRNKAVHLHFKSNEIERTFNLVKKYELNTDAKFNKLVAPNHYDCMTFDDFIMFSRSSNSVAKYIYYNIQYDPQKLILPNDTTIINNLKQKSNNRNRSLNLIKRHIATEFNINDLSDKQINEILDNIL